MGKAQSLPISALALINPLLSTPPNAGATKERPREDGLRARAPFLTFKHTYLKTRRAERR